jgi:hypothetical protein
MTRATKDLKLSDRELLRIIIAAQRDIAGILQRQFINNSSMEDAKVLAHDLDELLKGIPSQTHKPAGEQ